MLQNASIIPFQIKMNLFLHRCMFVLYQLCGQARADNKGMMVVLLKSRRKGDAKRGTLLRYILN